MTTYERLKKMEAASQLIALKATGAPPLFAKKLSISESSLYELLGLLKDWGAKIHYDKYRQTYEFIDGKCFFIGVIPSGMKNILGGFRPLQNFRSNKLHFCKTFN